MHLRQASFVRNLCIHSLWCLKQQTWYHRISRGARVCSLTPEMLAGHSLTVSSWYLSALGFPPSLCIPELQFSQDCPSPAPSLPIFAPQAQACCPFSTNTSCSSSHTLVGAQSAMGLLFITHRGQSSLAWNLTISLPFLPVYSSLHYDSLPPCHLVL